jgi:hypothetical protein
MPDTLSIVLARTGQRVAQALFLPAGAASPSLADRATSSMSAPVVIWRQ